MSEWISVTDRMPDDGTIVIVYEPGHDTYYAWFCAEDGGLFRDDQGFSWHPSHWMPLPEPPK